ADGAAAVHEVTRAAAADEPYAIVFLDWQMPSIDGIATAEQIRRLALDHPPRLAIITAYGRDELFKSAEAAGIDDLLIKPLNASILFDTVMRSLGAVPEETPASTDAVSTLESGLSSIAGARILLVEDNDMNQQVATELLEGAGFAVDLAENGEIALAKLRQATYDIVLMDMQMPVLDGIAATREIRRHPEYRDLPIVAMTASAMLEDREKCLDAGMQDHLAKPIEPDDLWRALLKWVKPKASTARPPATTRAPDSAPDAGEIHAGDLPTHIAGVDLALGLKRALGKSALYLALLRKFVAGQAAAPAAIVAALAADDWQGAERLAHTLKGTAANIGANNIQAVAGRLEESLKTRAARTQIDRLLSELSLTLAPTIEALRESLPSDESVATARATIDFQQVNTLASRLASLLADDDSEAIDLLAEHAEVFRAAFGDRYPPIAACVHHFEFDAALSVLQAATAELVPAH
ncbi:MAG: response regulator, partial [Propionivibrio sp.]